jgi:hypothetical protein
MAEYDWRKCNDLDYILLSKHLMEDIFWVDIPNPISLEIKQRIV